MIDLKDFITYVNEELKMEVSSEIHQQIATFLEFFIEKSKVINLTAIKDEKEIIHKHLIDSVALLKWVDLSDKEVVDLGSGGGFPAIPLAILCPTAHFTLIESTGKKTKFLEEAVKMANIKNVTILNRRAEEIDNFSPSLRNKFDYATARALSELRILLELSIPYLKIDGHLLAYKSQKTDEEIRNAKHALSELHSEATNIYKYSILGEERTIVEVQKKQINNKYPRTYNLIKKKPL